VSAALTLGNVDVDISVSIVYHQRVLVLCNLEGICRPGGN